MQLLGPRSSGSSASRPGRRRGRQRKDQVPLSLFVHNQRALRDPFKHVLSERAGSTIETCAHRRLAGGHGFPHALRESAHRWRLAAHARRLSRMSPHQHLLHVQRPCQRCQRCRTSRIRMATVARLLHVKPSSGPSFTLMRVSSSPCIHAPVLLESRVTYLLAAVLRRRCIC
jgi:hypothetical protein